MIVLNGFHFLEEGECPSPEMKTLGKARKLKRSIKLFDNDGRKVCEITKKLHFQFLDENKDLCYGPPSLLGDYSYSQRRDDLMRLSRGKDRNGHFFTE